MKPMKRYGRKSSYVRSSKTQILNRKHVPLDIVIQGGQVDVLSPLDSVIEGEKNVEGITVLRENNATQRGRSKICLKKNQEQRESLVEPISSDLPIPTKSTNKHTNNVSSTSISKTYSQDKAHPFKQIPSIFQDIRSTKNVPKKTSIVISKKSATAVATLDSTNKIKNTTRLVPRKKTPTRSKFKKSPKQESVAADSKKMIFMEKECIIQHGDRSLKIPKHLPKNVGIRTENKSNAVETGGTIQVYEKDNQLSVRTGTTKKLMLGDVSSSVKEEDEFKPKTLIKTEYRTKSSRQKRKFAADEPIKNKKQRVQDNTCVIFNVPEFEMGRYGEDKYQERKYLGLIEGVGGGVEEKGKKDEIPHRGRLIELPGELMPGDWKAQVLFDGSDDSMNQRISLRHEGANNSSLEAYLRQIDSAPLSVINPIKNRVRCFIDQGILDDDEIYDEKAGEEKVLGSAFIGCISLVWFDGFTSASEAVHSANDVSEELLKSCVPSIRGASEKGLYKIIREQVGKDKEESLRGILFKTKLDFDDEYTILVSHNGFEIDAVDVIFKKINVHSDLNRDVFSTIQRCGLTSSLLSHHLDCVGSSVDDIMARFKYGDENARVETSVTYNVQCNADNVIQTEPLQQIGKNFTKRRNTHGANKHIAKKVDGIASETLEIDAQNILDTKNDCIVEDSKPVVSTWSKNQEDILDESLSQKELHRSLTHENGSIVEVILAEKLFLPTPNSTSSHALEIVETRTHKTISNQNVVIDQFQKSDDEERTLEPTVAEKNMKRMRFTNKESLSDHSGKQVRTRNLVKLSERSFILGPSMHNSKTSKQVNDDECISQKDPEIATEPVDVVEEMIGSVRALNTTAKPKIDIKGSKDISSVMLEANNKTESSDNGNSNRIKISDQTERRSFDGDSRSLSNHQKIDSYKTSRTLTYTEETKSCSPQSSAPSKLNKFQTPNNIIHPRHFIFNGMMKSHKPATRIVCDTKHYEPARKKLNYLSLKKSLTKKKEYVCDLFGDNESMFGIPTIKTPSARWRSADDAPGEFSEKRSQLCIVSTKSFKSCDKKRRLTSLKSCDMKASKVKSPVVTPGGRNVDPSLTHTHYVDTSSILLKDPYSLAVSTIFDEALSSEEEKLGHDDASASFRENLGEGLPVLPTIQSQKGKCYSPPQCLKDEYYEQSSSSSCVSLSNKYYGGRYYMRLYDDSSMSTVQPAYDVYFGQYTHCNALSSAELPVYQDSTQAFHDVYFGQQEARGNGNIHKCYRRPDVARKQRTKIFIKPYFLILLIGSMFYSVMEPESMRSYKHSISASIFNQTHLDTTPNFKTTASGWLSFWSS